MRRYDPARLLRDIASGRYPQARYSQAVASVARRMATSEGRADVRHCGLLNGIIYLRDGGRGRSITNDAEGVVKRTVGLYGRRRIVYRDTEGHWAELVHQDGRFVGFAPWPGDVPRI